MTKEKWYQVWNELDGTLVYSGEKPSALYRALMDAFCVPPYNGQATIEEIRDFAAAIVRGDSTLYYELFFEARVVVCELPVEVIDC